MAHLCIVKYDAKRRGFRTAGVCARDGSLASFKVVAKTDSERAAQTVCVFQKNNGGGRAVNCYRKGRRVPVPGKRKRRK